MDSRLYTSYLPVWDEYWEGAEDKFSIIVCIVLISERMTNLEKQTELYVQGSWRVAAAQSYPISAYMLEYTVS